LLSGKQLNHFSTFKSRFARQLDEKVRQKKKNHITGKKCLYHTLQTHINLKAIFLANLIEKVSIFEPAA
jgi:hypothetical protein